MRYREITSKGILYPVRGEDDWFGLSYNLNLYRGCEHQCVYCDTRSSCYRIENFNKEVLIKINAIPLLDQALARKRKVGFIGFGSMNDAYTTAERHYQLTSQALAIVAKYRFPVHIITKSDLVLKDLAVLKQINQVRARVSFTITTTDDALAKILEPGASSPSQRLAAMRQLSRNGIETGVVMMPILPFIEDKPENIDRIVTATATYGGQYIIPAFGMSIRNGQREYFYHKLDEYFPGLRERYEQTFGNRYHCPAQNSHRLAERFYEQCERFGLPTKITSYSMGPNYQQLELL